MRKIFNIFVILTLLLNTSLLNNCPSYAKGIKDAIKKSDNTTDKNDKKIDKTDKKVDKNDNLSKSNDYCDDSDECDESDECDIEDENDESDEIEEDDDESDECEVDDGEDSEECDISKNSKKSEKKEKTEKTKKTNETKDSKNIKNDNNTKETPQVKNYDLVFDDILTEAIYPSFILFAQMNKEMSETPLIHFYIEDENAHAKVTVEENDFMEQCVSEHDMTKEDECIFSPWIKWKRNALLNADKPGFINFTAVLEVNGKVKNRVNKTITYRSVNEAILGLLGENDEFEDLTPLLSCFVNEDHPRIDKVLNEIIDKDKKTRKI